jgi:proteasome lid subunit RPN8/RPN11
MAPDKSTNPGSAKISLRELVENEKPFRRTFPGPRHADARLRVAIERGAYAELIAHAKASLNAEVCGVLAGNLCEDDEGLFVHVEATIRGSAAKEGGTHVTFTQSTWNAIHKTLENDHPKLKIAGWYHTHPGFGVEFSEMDVFIHRNFFPRGWHLALVTDPLSGAVAIGINQAGKVEYLDRYWVDGREQQCRLPAGASGAGGAETSGGTMAGESERLRVMEDRLSQLVQSLDELRAFHYRFMLVCGFVFCLALIGTAAYSIYSQWGSRLEPPKVNQVVPVPVQVGDKTVILGVAVTSWQVPPELDAILLQAELAERAAKAKQAGETNAAPPGSPGGTASQPAGNTNRP